ncbi:hypothetical protein [Pseudomonas rhizoryzae]|uniref:hypothetical protein n=1 Tax=Pseudomonas rhizoryzae TaxID=2571129 RepID=UPI0010C1BC62|nr:hypothetical protein [Pseudomonas rhizoryzae]
MARDTYPVVADKWAAALGPFTTEMNNAITWMGQQIDAAAASKKAAADSATAAAQSVSDAAAQVQLAKNQVTAASTQANNSQTYANQSKDYRDSSQAAAAAAQAAAGIPAISGKADYMLSVNSAGNGVEFRVSVPRPTSATSGYALAINQAGDGYAAQPFPTTPISKYYESPQQSIAAGGTFSVAHGLGLIPKVVSAYLVCKSAFGGYAVGERVEWPIGHNYLNANGNSGSCGGSITFTNSELAIRFGVGGGPIVINKDNGNPFLAGPYFNIVLRAMG